MAEQSGRTLQRLTGWARLWSIFRRLFWPDDLVFPWTKKDDLKPRVVRQYHLTYEQYFKYYEAIRTYITQENTILNFRTTWTILFIGPALNAIVTLLKDKDVTNSFAANYPDAFVSLIYISTDAILIAACALWAGGISTSKVVVNLIHDWREVRNNIIIDGDPESSKPYYIPPFYSGRNLYLFGILSRLAVAFACIAIGVTTSSMVRKAVVSSDCWLVILDVGARCACVWMIYRPLLEAFFRPYDKERHHEHSRGLDILNYQ